LRSTRTKARRLPPPPAGAPLPSMAAVVLLERKDARARVVPWPAPGAVRCAADGACAAARCPPSSSTLRKACAFFESCCFSWA
jgi:hypothetical protein